MKGNGMVLGAVGCSLATSLQAQFSLHVADARPGIGGCEGRVGGEAVGTRNAGTNLAANSQVGSWLVLSGNPLLPAPNGALARAKALTAAELLEHLTARGLDALEALDGQFAIAWWEGSSGTLRLMRDRFGMEPLAYWRSGKQCLFGSRARDVARSLPGKPQLSTQGLAEYLTHCYLPGDNTLFEGVTRVPPGGIVEFLPATQSLVVRNWYRLSFLNPVVPDEGEIATRYRELLEASIVRRLDDGRAGIFLSGGMDSSSAATFARRHLQSDIGSFSFRCAGASFDESDFARQLAQELGTRHTEVDYGEPQALEALDAVAVMDMPFCDIGIEIGTWLLSKAAGGRVDYLLTGDGGDEIWASHPVYAAQRIMRWYDRVPIPKLLRSGLVKACGVVPDSDQKRNLAVVLKRLLPEPDFPDDLMHYRWRMYYTARSLRSFMAPSLAEAIEAADPFQVVAQSFENYQGPDDGLSPCLYSDYRTVCGFYFSRVLLARNFGLEMRLPFMDRDLVEFGARIPVHLKLEGIERTKRLFRVAMEGILPDVINHRKDKMGHSVPFKNWLRGDGVLNVRVLETLRSAQFRDRGLFRTAEVERMLDEHRTRRHNHSHRIWALFILEHWMRIHFDPLSSNVRGSL